MFSKGSISVLNSSTASMRMNGSTIQSGDRIARLKEKIDGIQVSIEREKTSQVERLNLRLDSLDEKLKQTMDNRAAAVSSLSSEINKLEQYLSDSVAQRESSIELKRRQLKAFEQRNFELLDQFAYSRKEQEKAVLDLIDDKTNMVRLELSKEAAVREEETENIKACLENDIPRLQDALKSLTLERNEFDNEFVKKTSEDIQKLNAAMMEEKKTSEDTEEALLEMLREVVNRMKGDIENEKKDRESSEDMLLGLLEETCTKLNLTTQGGSS